MELPTPLIRSHPWRAAALVAAALAALELVLIVAALAIAGNPFGSDAQGARTKDAVPAGNTADGHKKAPVAHLSRGRTSVIVLNGNGQDGAAGQAASRLRRYHYMIAATANAPRTDIARSIVMFRPGFRGEAARLAKDFGVSRVSPLDGIRPSELEGAHVALIVGRN